MGEEIRAARDGVVGPERLVRIGRLVSIFATETPLPTRAEIACRLGCSVGAIQRDLGTVEFAHGLDERIADELADDVRPVFQLHRAVMNDESAKPGERLAAGRWLYARWRGAKRASCAIRGESPATMEATESALLASVLTETKARRASAKGAGEEEPEDQGKEATET